MIMKEKVRCIFLFLFLIFKISTAFAQQNLTFHVADFSYDAFDQTARDERFKKYDGSGFMYAIVKVIGDSPADNLSEYRFNFGNMNHIVEVHDGELWLYVQKNAKIVTITRSGYFPVNRYDLNTTIESGKTYRMKLSAQAAKVYTQMVMFEITPVESKAMVMITKEENGQKEEEFGSIDETGGVAKSLKYGTYTYRVMAENYYQSEGRFTLNNQAETYVEKVVLLSNGTKVVLDAGVEADIYVNGSKRGTGKWTGSLKAGIYTIECRMSNHRPSKQTISIEDGKEMTVKLTPPTPITGTLAISSHPFEADIKIDGKDYGKSPRHIQNFIIGYHTIVVSKDGYKTKEEQFEIHEGESISLELTLEKKSLSHTAKADGDKTFTVDNVTFTMKPVVGGTFKMGTTKEKESEASSLETPSHEVTLNDYYISETEVTQELWQTIMGKNPSWPKGPSLPVVDISWDACQNFIQKLNMVTGQNFRLPTEAEWEYAARGGKYSKGYRYSGSNNIDEVAWHINNTFNGSYHEIQPVKSKVANEIGIYDMSGNVKEWCSDWYGIYTGIPLYSPLGPVNGSYRIIRGGCYFAESKDCRVSARSFAKPSYKHETGLRLAMSAE